MVLRSTFLRDTVLAFTLCVAFGVVWGGPELGLAVATVAGGALLNLALLVRASERFVVQAARGGGAAPSGARLLVRLMLGAPVMALFAASFAPAAAALGLSTVFLAVVIHAAVSALRHQGVPPLLQESSC